MSDYLLKLTKELLHKDGPIHEELVKTKKKIVTMKKNKKILIVDDQRENIMVIQLLLNSEGYEIFTASNGLEAIDIYKGNSDISKIYMDMRMPIMGGIEATKVIREFEKDNNITPCIIIAVTAYAGYQEIPVDGINSVILKPVTKTRLLKDTDTK